ncbi:MAG: DeoR/GlpR transcriptional regulator [Gemmatimonadaceae bacterium]|nr:DeoR/GlpR transcriptional regulator [Chitinophagaceae bacterium]
MLKEERKDQILAWLKKHRRVLLPELSRHLNVSEDTVRRDIKELSMLKLLKEVRGGAIPHAPGPREFSERSNFAGRQKMEMAKKAVQLIERGSVIIFDGGTSAMAVASQLPVDFDLTVLTNSFPVADVLEERKDVNLLFAGGKLLRESLITTGHETIAFFNSMRADICFLGVCSIDLKLGLTGHHYEEAAVKKSMIAASNFVAALSTTEKINTAETYSVCPLSSITHLVAPTSAFDLLKPYKKAGITVL